MDAIDADLEAIEIYTRWVGFASPPSHVAKLLITPTTGGFSRSWFPSGQIDAVTAMVVRQLLAAVAQPLVTRMDARLFDLPEPVLRSHYGSMWTDDSPAHLVKIRFTTGRLVTIRTDAQHAFMLPLQVSDFDARIHGETFDPRLSKAIAALMPDNYLERDRLAGRLGLLHWDLQRHLSQKAGAEASKREEVCLAAETFSGTFGMLSCDATIEEKVEAARGAVTADVQGTLIDAVRNQCWRQGEAQLEAMRALIGAGADVERADRDGITPLEHARRVLARVDLDEEVAAAFDPDADFGLSCEQHDRQMAEAVVDLLVSACRTPALDGADGRGG
jgi:hypothetical protein